MSPKENYTYLITTSILDSFNWLNSCPPSWRDRAYKGIVASLKREPWTPHKTAERGINFENMIFSHSRSIVNNTGSKYFQAMVDRVKGGRFQQVIKKTIKGPRDRNVLLYGKADVVMPDKIIDIKTTEVYRGDDKYLNGWQHILYLYMTGLCDFTYLVALFEEFPSNNMIDVYAIDYHVDNPNELLQDIKDGVGRFHEWLEDEGLFHHYEQTFSNNARR